jgi:KipI family sensor histidine kinase inhibitor
MSAIAIEPLGDGALLIRVGDRIDADINRTALVLADALRAAAMPGVRDIAAAYASVCVRYDMTQITEANGLAPHEIVTLRISEIVGTLNCDAFSTNPSSTMTEPECIEIPVCYGGEFGSDIDAVAARAQLEVGEVIARHSAAEYRVAMLGFMPGFAYLLGLDPLLHTPRRENPRTRVPAGSVAIGGAQTGIYPRELPGGWQLIGRTPQRLFDPARAQPALLQPGQRVRFRAIDTGEFAALAPHDDPPMTIRQ